MSQNTRRWIYGVAAAGAPVAVWYGLVAEEAAGLWIGLAGALLGLGGNALARRNTPKIRKPKGTA